MTATVDAAGRAADPARAVRALRPVRAARNTAVLDLVVPVHNEEQTLAPSIVRLHEFLTRNLPFSFRITIADNASTDATWLIAQRLEEEISTVRAVHLDEKGRGRALRAAWTDSDAQVLGYTDVDLSTDLAALVPMVSALVAGHSDLAIGSRLSRGSRVSRGARREMISRSYNLLLRTTLRAKFRDAQCGFKFIRADAAKSLLPLVADEEWFFDTELLVLAERSGMRILEIPVDWVDDPDSRVDIVRTALADLRGIARIGRGLVSGSLGSRLPTSARRRAPLPPKMGRQLLRFATVGIVSTAAFLVIFAALRQVTGPLTANFLALLLTAIGNTAANRRFTFGIRGRRDAGRHHLVGLAAFAIGLAVTTGSLQALAWLSPGSGRLPEMIVLIGANAVATLLRFVLLRAAVGASQPTPRELELL
jgi:putative flippase GtrA